MKTGKLDAKTKHKLGHCDSKSTCESMLYPEKMEKKNYIPLSIGIFYHILCNYECLIGPGSSHYVNRLDKGAGAEFLNALHKTLHGLQSSCLLPQSLSRMVRSTQPFQWLPVARCIVYGLKLSPWIPSS